MKYLLIPSLSGVEVSIMLRGEKITTHLQVDWMYMLVSSMVTVSMATTFIYMYNCL